MDAPPTTIDLKRLAAEVSLQHGIRVDPDDPMMAVVTLNRLVFEQAVGQVLERVQASVRDFETATDKVQVRAEARGRETASGRPRRSSKCTPGRAKVVLHRLGIRLWPIRARHLGRHLFTVRPTERG